jgi:hypothetical protein
VFFRENVEDCPIDNVCQSIVDDKGDGVFADCGASEKDNGGSKKVCAVVYAMVRSRTCGG